MRSEPDYWLTVLGSGTGMPSVRRAGPCMLVEGGGLPFMVDCGPGSLLRLAALGIQPTDIAAILFTHFHIDHCNDLPAILFSRRSPELPMPIERLRLIGKGVSMHYRGLTALYGSGVEPREGVPLLCDLDEGFPDLGPWCMEWVPTKHIESSVAYRLNAPDGSSLVFSGDTGPSEALEVLARDADLLVLECSFPDPCPCEIHLSPTTAGILAARARVKRLMLTHLFPTCDHATVIETVQSHYSGAVMLAEDGLRVAW